MSEYDELMTDAVNSLIEDYLMYSLRDGERPDLWDSIHEIADNMTPVYNYDRLQIVMDNTSLWCAALDDPGLIDPDDISICNLAGILIYEEIYKHLAEWLTDHEEDIAYMFVKHIEVSADIFNDLWEDMEDEEFDDAISDLHNEVLVEMDDNHLAQILYNELESLIYHGRQQ